MYVTLSGISMLSKLSQSKNASPPIVVNVLGSVTLVKLVFLSKIIMMKNL